MEKIFKSTELIVSNIFKIHKLADVVRKSGKRKHLVSNMTAYPNNGVGFEIWKPDWEPGTVSQHCNPLTSQNGQIMKYL